MEGERRLKKNLRTVNISNEVFSIWEVFCAEHRTNSTYICTHHCQSLEEALEVARKWLKE
jgi:hypothetical protein